MTAHVLDDGPLIYEVNLEVDPEAAPGFEAWLASHIRDMLRIDGFESATWASRRGVDEGRPEVRDVLWTVCYRLRDRAALDAYLSGPAAEMRRAGLDRFGDRFRASRRVLHVLATVDRDGR